MTRASLLSALMLSFFVQSAASVSRFAHARHHSGRLAAGNLSDIDVFRDRHRLEEAVALAVLGDVDDAVADGLARRPVAHGSSVETHVAAMKEVALDDAGDDLGRFRAA